MKDQVGEKTVTKCVGLKPKIYAYLIDDGNNDKKAKRTKKCAIK